MAEDPVAAHQKKARRQGAHLAVIDESGLLMAPLVRRTWASRGRTPELVQRCGKREKVSVAAALWLSPLRDRLGLFARTLVNGDFDNWYSAAFLEALLKELPGRVVVVWDGGSMHKGDPIAQLQNVMSDRWCLERFPPYSPQLSPVEPVWSWRKYSRLCNFAPEDAIPLDGCVVAELSAIRDDQELLRGFWHASDLPFPRTLLS
ncbi:MAG TPA: transposase [Isosphaeraceae bacterium]|nr:transposase [Isosphaeraceae bacterium]